MLAAPRACSTATLGRAAFTSSAGILVLVWKCSIHFSSTVREGRRFVTCVCFFFLVFFIYSLSIKVQVCEFTHRLHLQRAMRKMHAEAMIPKQGEMVVPHDVCRRCRKRVQSLIIFDKCLLLRLSNKSFFFFFTNDVTTKNQGNRHRDTGTAEKRREEKRKKE